MGHIDLVSGLMTILSLRLHAMRPLIPTMRMYTWLWLLKKALLVAGGMQDRLSNDFKTVARRH